MLKNNDLLKYRQQFLTRKGLTWNSVGSLFTKICGQLGRTISGDQLKERFNQASTMVQPKIQPCMVESISINMDIDQNHQYGFQGF